eukprot:TRINITY_DN14898_c0_g1_i2.p1 TRINITY_DN14898_c0_g1~~TRINITY_DN14898_c0_g1_i2.p1  ORF type:complete len:300 (+),score=99.92 TRINITY_DN14898_c0_g1_i2:994-1893(+)
MARIRSHQLLLAWLVLLTLVFVSTAWHHASRHLSRVALPQSGAASPRTQLARVPVTPAPVKEFAHGIKWSHEPGCEWLASTRNHTNGLLHVVEEAGSSVLPWRVVSKEKPRVLVFDSFLKDGEAEQLISLAEKKLTRSRIVARNSGGKVADVRTSEGAFLTDGSHVVRVLKNRVSQAALLPVAHLESVQILRYRPGQRYRMHPDFFVGKKKEKVGHLGQRVATLLTWINDVAQGGETKFNADPPLQLSPKKNRAVLFYSVDAEGKEDYASMHEGRPPEGNSTKWVAVFWMRRGPFARSR